LLARILAGSAVKLPNGSFSAALDRRTWKQRLPTDRAVWQTRQHSIAIVSGIFICNSRQSCRHIADTFDQLGAALAMTLST
jgi:hypothetical protein